MDDQVLVCTDTNVVAAYTFPEGKKAGVELRFSAAATSVKVSDTWIAAGSEDFTIKAMKRDKSEPYFDLEEHEAPIICMDLCDNLLASRGGDGKIIIWNLETKTVVHRITGLELCKSFELAETFGTVTFNINGGKFAYSDGKNKVIVLGTDTWTELFSLTDSGLSGNLTACAFSPLDKCLAAGTSRGEINVWSLKTKKSLRGDVKGTEPNPIMSIAWNPSAGDEFCFTDACGSLEVVTNATDSGENSGVKQKTSRKAVAPAEPSENEDIYNELGFIDDAAEDDNNMDDDDDGVSLDRIKNETLGMTGFQDGSIGGDGPAEDEKRPPSSLRGEMIPAVNLQPPFQPGSTPVGLEHRFMVWNHVGIVRSHKTDEQDMIEVEFHDSSTHHGIHTENHLNHIFASLSPAVLALACETPR